MKHYYKKDFGIILLLLLISIIHLVVNTTKVFAVPSGPNVTAIRNETAAPQSAALINTSGGSITTMVLNATTQNLRWKAYVGNVTGTLTLDDAAGYSIFDWSITTALTGEVYATRSSSTPNWANIGCATPTNITNEEKAINHTSNPNDNSI